MYRERCRPSYSNTELKDIYCSHWVMKDDWEDHRRRIAVTREVILETILPEFTTAADLSCGDGLWKQEFPFLQWQLGDYAPGYEFRGPIESTIRDIAPVDLFVCCETLEHLDDPDSVLRAIREKARRVVLSTPNSFQWDENPEHYWAWDKESFRDMLGNCGWTPVAMKEANAWWDPTRVNGYAFQIWGCE